MRHVQIQLQTVRDVMTPDPIVLEADATVADAAKLMKARDIGDVLVSREGKLMGIVTDRDLVVRCLAGSPSNPTGKLGDICTKQIATLEADAEIGAAIQLMEERAIRRVPVTRDGQAIGIVSLGDLAMARDTDSVLGRISAARPNR